MVSATELASVAQRVPDREGWDFSALQIDEETPPWVYAEVVRGCLSGTEWVADLGTGGGEVFLDFAGRFAQGFGLDHNGPRLQTALENASAANAQNVAFLLADASALPFPEGSLDLVLARHADYTPAEVVRVLRPGGHFVTQQMGDRDQANIFAAFGWGSYGSYWRERFRREGRVYRATLDTAKIFKDLGCEVITYDEYDVPRYVPDIESLVFWLKASPLPEAFDPRKHWQPISRLIEEGSAAGGIRTNAHRELLMVRRP